MDIHNKKTTCILILFLLNSVYNSVCSKPFQTICRNNHLNHNPNNDIFDQTNKNNVKLLHEILTSESKPHQHHHHLTALDKAKIMYKKCLHVGTEGDINGIQTHHREIMMSNSTERDIFSREIAQIHKKHTYALFRFRITEMIQRNKKGSRKMAMLTQPPLIGRYTTNTKIQKQANTAKFSELAKIIGLKLSKTEMQKIVSFEKRLSNHTLPPESVNNMAEVKKHSKKYRVPELKGNFPFIHWELYLEEILRDIQDVKMVSVMVAHEPYFKALYKALRETDEQTVLVYVRMAAIHSIGLKNQKVFSEKSAKRIYGNATRRRGEKTCDVIVEEAFPHVIAKSLWDQFNFGGKRKLLKEIIINSTRNFKKIIIKTNALSTVHIQRAIDKVNNITEIIGVPSFEENDRYVNEHYEKVKENVTFVQMYQSVQENYFNWLLQGLVHNIDDETINKNRPDDANAFYDLQNNRMVLNPGLLMPPFNDERLNQTVFVARFSTIIGHELFHIVGREGRHFRKDGLYEDLDEEKDPFTQKMDDLKDVVAKVCTQNNLLERLIHKKTKVTPNFDHLEEEITADLGGLQIAAMNFQDFVGKDTNRYHEGIQSFLKICIRMFCKKSSYKMTKYKLTHGPHPTNECRVKYLRRTQLFREAFGCGKTVSEIDLW